MKQQSKNAGFAVFIKDMSRWGFLAFDVPDILSTLSLTHNEVFWVVSITDWAGHAVREVADVVLSTEELLALYQPGCIYQTIDGVFRAYPVGLDGTEAIQDDHSFAESPALVEIRAIDSSFFIVATRDFAHVEAIKRRFTDVTDCDPSRI